MATQGRRSGTRRRKTETAASEPVEAPAVATAVIEIIEPAAADTSGAAELLDDQSVAIAGSRRGFSLGRAFPGAVVGSLLVVGLAFGAAGPGGALGPKATDGKDLAGPGGASAITAAGAAGGAAHVRDDGITDADDTDPTKDVPDGADDDPTAKPDAGEDGKDGTDEDGTGGKDGDGDRDAPKKDPEPDPTRKPKPEETKKPAEDPDPDPGPGDVDPIALALGIKDQHPILEWGSCEGLAFDYYKVVRSTDSTVSWPTGSGDELIGAVERGGYRKAWDKYAPHGDKVWYRVFCVRKTEAGYKVVNASVVKGIEVPEETPPPDPVSIDLDAAINDEGKVVLVWEACNVDGFAFYKVVRSDWNENPSYLPWTDGSEVIGVVEGRYQTEWHDLAPDPGDTAYYRVQCIGYHDGQKVLLGESAVVVVTMP